MGVLRRSRCEVRPGLLEMNFWNQGVSIAKYILENEGRETVQVVLQDLSETDSLQSLIEMLRVSTTNSSGHQPSETWQIAPTTWEET